MSCVDHQIHQFVGMCKPIECEGVNWGQGKPNITWKEVVSRDLRSLRIHVDLAKEKDLCRQCQVVGNMS